MSWDDAAEREVREFSRVKVIPLTPASDPDWYRDHENLAALYRDLRDRNEEPDVAHFLEEPWHWTTEWVRHCHEGEVLS